MAIHYNLTLLHDKLGDSPQQSLASEIDFFVHDISARLKEIKLLIEEKDRAKMQEILPEIVDYLIVFGVLHAHQDGEDLLKWMNGKGKRKEAMTLYNSLLENYKLAKKEIKKDYLIS
jgi:hypothetical protein